MIVELNGCDVAVILSAINHAIRETTNDPAFVRDLKVAYRKVSGAGSMEEPVLNRGFEEEVPF